MDVDKCRQLRDHLAALPEERFDYGSYIGQSRGDAKYSEAQMRLWHDGRLRDLWESCGCAGCVAGHCFALFDLPGRPSTTGTAFALDLSSTMAWFLCLEYCDRANRLDAIRRLDHLLAGGTPEDYDWNQESWAGGTTQ